MPQVAKRAKQTSHTLGTHWYNLHLIGYDLIVPMYQHRPEVLNDNKNIYCPGSTTSRIQIIYVHGQIIKKDRETTTKELQTISSICHYLQSEK